MRISIYIQLEINLVGSLVLSCQVCCNNQKLKALGALPQTLFSGFTALPKAQLHLHYMEIRNDLYGVYPSKVLHFPLALINPLHFILFLKLFMTQSMDYKLIYKVQVNMLILLTSFNINAFWIRNLFSSFFIASS